MVELLTVREGIKCIEALYPELATCLVPAKNNPHLKLIKLSYPYGASIVENGKFQLPEAMTNQQPLASLGVDYCDIPLALVLTKGCEVSLSNEQRSMPLNLLHAGQLFGIFETISWLVKDPKRVMWQVTAGSRSAFMLPSIHDGIAHQRLQQKCHVTTDAPQNLLEHSSLFAQLNAKTPVPWQCEVLLFPKDWFTDPGIQDQLFRFIFEIGWKQSQRIRDQAVLDHLNELFNTLMNKRKTTIPPAIVEKIKHFLMLGNGSLPGFGPALDETFLPVSTIQKAYRDIYQLKQYAPLIAQPQFLIPGAPIYYFLNFPYSASIYKSGIKSLLSELKYIKTTFQHFLIELKKSPNVELFKNIDRIHYRFFHRGAEAGEILAASSMAALDKRWMAQVHEEAFPNHAPALSGCIQLSMER
jgi:hypothetical protein